ncbi:MAG: ribonuclease R [Gammaproteobacteria bacterium]|nr:ribonuclease R [Gammaproteobacteria bacterium]
MVNKETSKKKQSRSKSASDKSSHRKSRRSKSGGAAPQSRTGRHQARKPKFDKVKKSAAGFVDPQAEREKGNYENPIASRELILQVVHEDGAMSHEKLEDVLKMDSPEQKEALRRRLNAMVRDGQLIRNRRDGYVPVNEEDLIAGRVIAHPDGFGFLVPDEGDEDIFLHGRQMRTLLHGDRAVVQVSGMDRRGRLEGAVIEVLERANSRVVGRLFIESGVAFVTPDNKRLTQDIIVPIEDIGEAEHGQIVIVEITQQPNFRHQPIGKVTDIIGDHMAPGMEIDVAIHAHSLPFLWPDEVKEQVKSYGTEVTEEDKKNRVDIRHLPLVTIDGEDTQDFDDAVYCEATANGWKLYVAIADVAHYVERGSALDEEAYNRGTSVYFPGRVIPMLPEVLSNGLCSINPKVDRLCMVCEMLFNKDGKMLRTKFFEGVMNSHERLTYNQVAAMLVDGDEKTRQQFKHVLPHLEDLFDLYKVLAKQRKKRGAIDFETTETRIIFSDNQRIDRIVPTERNEAHKLIEECMISANVAAARFLERNKIPGLYRVHDGPKEEKIDDVKDFILSLGLNFGKAKSKLKSILSFGLGNRKTKITAKTYAELIEQVKLRPDFHLIQTVLLRSLSQAVYSPDNEGHFGLSLETYAHFTSPIRRYPDLLVHRAIRHIVQGQKVQRYFYRHSDMVTLGEHSSACERRADEATRDAMTALKCEYMLDKVGERFDGIISAVTSFGIFVELQDIYIEGLVHITGLPKDYYQYEPVGHKLIGERGGLVFQLGDSITVDVAGVNMDERKIDFNLAAYDAIENKKRKSRKGSQEKTGKPAPKKKAAKKKQVKKKTARKKTAKKD